MKTKKFNKKLPLNKTTVANLNISEQAGIKAGGGPTMTMCTDPTYCDTYSECTHTWGDFCTEGWVCK